MKRYIHSDSVSNYSNKYELYQVVQNTNDINLIKECATSDDWFLRCGAAKNPNLPVDLIIKLANDEDSSARQQALVNPSMPADELLNRLAEGIDSSTRKTLARSTKNADVLNVLVDDSNPEVRYWVATNDHTSRAALEKLATDNTSVRLDIGDRANIAKGAKYTLSKLTGLPSAEPTFKNWPDPSYWDEVEDDEEIYQSYLAGPEDKIETKLKVFTEPSTQGGVGSMFIYDQSGKNRFGPIEVDYQEWCDAEFEMASSSKSAAEYAKKYEKFIKSLI